MWKPLTHRRPDVKARGSADGTPLKEEQREGRKVTRRNEMMSMEQMRMKLSANGSLLVFAAGILGFALLSGCSATARSGGQMTPGASEDWIRTELFFGLSEGGTVIPPDQWQDFVDKSITPRFPDGLTIVFGNGQYRTSEGQVAKEPTAILILLHKKETEGRDDASLEAIGKEYDARFGQESVLRCDSEARVEFISAGANK
jgi:hypothetical protein